MKEPVALVLILSLVAAPAFAERVVLKSGQVYSGEIVEETEEFVRLRTDGKILQIERTEIAEIVSPDVEVEVSLERLKQQTLLDAEAKGREAAEHEISKIRWIGIGCLTGPRGLVIASAVAPTPPQTHLLGKDHEYAAAFIDAYKERGKSIQTNYAVLGCIGFGLGWGLVTYCLYMLLTSPLRA